MRKKFPMRFDSECERWCVELQGRNYGLHCGESVEIYIGGEPFPCSLEMDRQWYVILKDVRFYLRPSDKYMVSI